MKRLIEQDHDARPGDAYLASLVRASIEHAEPAAPMDRARVLRRVLAGEHRAGPGFYLRLGAVAVVLSGAAVAAASAGRLWRPTPRPAPVFAVASAIAPESTPAPPFRPAEPAADGLVSEAAVTARGPTNDAPSARVKAPSKTTPYRDGEDPTPVLQAIRALRQEGDPSRAGDLLAAYLRAHPRGVLAEDALALSIEAAAARHDTRAAADLGRRYLAQFPNGRFRAFAQRVGRP